MTDTVWVGGVHKLVDNDSILKDKKAVLEERGIDTTDNKANNMATN